MTHLIASDGVAGYFPSMLSDRPRAASYDAAIRAAVDEFAREEGQYPVVVDVGCGTGLLTWLAVRHGADHVYAVDTNPTALKLAKSALVETFGKARVRRTVTFVAATDGGGVPSDVPPVDMIVSEILGTLVNSEDAAKYVGLYMRGCLRTFGPSSSPRVYVVPRFATQTLALHAFRGVWPALRVAVENAVAAAWRQRNWSPTTENGLSVLLHAFPSTVLASDVVRTESYAVSPPVARWQSSARRTPMPSGEDARDSDMHLTVFEWEVLLWKGVPPLRNTLAELRAIAATDPSSAIARDSAWGFVVVPPMWGTVVRAECRGKGLRVSASGSEADRPPSGDFRGGDDEGTPLAPARFAADEDFARGLVAGMSDWIDAELGEDGAASATVVVYDDPTSGLVSDLAMRELRPRVRSVVVLGHADASFRNASEAYPSVREGAHVASRGWADWLASLPPPVVLLAPTLLTDPTGTDQRKFPFSKYATYPPSLGPVRSVLRQRFFPATAFGNVPGLAETGVLSLVQALRGKPIPVNLFPSAAYTHAMHRADVASSDAYYGLRSDTDTIRLLSDDSEGDEDDDEWTVHAFGDDASLRRGWRLGVRVRERSPPVPWLPLPACTLAHLCALARRDERRGGVFVDQISLVARATSQQDPPTLRPSRKHSV